MDRKRATQLLLLTGFLLLNTLAQDADGGWSDWNSWESCSVTCGGGLQTRNRKCTNPPPSMDSRYCKGSRSLQSRLCNTQHCPIHGGWSDWKEWSLCTKAIGGIQTRTRECVNLKPKDGGKRCNGTRVVARECRNLSSCHEAFPVRFRTGEIPSLGTMEIYKNNTWKKLCSASWDDAEDNLTCRAMGYFNNGPDDNSTRHEGINGSNTTIHRNCSPVTHNCVNNSKENLQSCEVPVRLTGANIKYGGRVEVYFRGKWGKICRNQWDLDDVKVVCNQLGFKGALAEFIGSEVKDVQIPFLMSKVDCSGSESNLASCKRNDGEYDDCSADKGAQALCEPKNREVLEKRTFVLDIGSSETFYCFLKSETYMIKWYVKGTGAISGGRIVAAGSTLTILNVQLSDGGTYECRGLKYTRFYTIYVNAKFTNVFPQQTIISGTSGILRCSALGTPIPQFDEWKKDGDRALDKDRFTQMPNGSLRVYPVRPEDKGIYTCTMKQNKGTHRITSKFQIIHVSVVGFPVDLRFVSSSGNSITLTWTSANSIITNYTVEVRCCEETTWAEAHCTENLIGRGCTVSDKTATVIGLKADKEYCFRVYAVYQNLRSAASSSSEEMKTKSEDRRRPQFISNSLDTITIKYQVPSVMQISYTVQIWSNTTKEWRDARCSSESIVNDSCVVTNLNTSITVTGLSPEHTYFVRVASFSQVFSQVSEPMETKKLGFPVDLRFVSSSSNSITLTWTSVNSIITNYTVEVRCCEETTWAEAHCTEILIGRGCTVSNKTATVIGLKADKVYCFRVYAVYKNLRSAASSSSEEMKTKSEDRNFLPYKIWVSPLSPECVTSELGHVITLFCHQPGSKLIVYEWTKRGRVLSNGSADGALNVSISSSEDFGVYTCHAVSQYGVTHYNITVCQKTGHVETVTEDFLNPIAIAVITTSFVCFAIFIVVLILLKIARIQRQRKKQSLDILPGREEMAMLHYRQKSSRSGNNNEEDLD